MPPVRSSASERRARVVAVILLFGKIMPTYFCCVLKGLVCVVIITSLGRQPFSYVEYTKSNIRLFCNIRSVSNAECAFLIRFCIL